MAGRDTKIYAGCAVRAGFENVSGMDEATAECMQSGCSMGYLQKTGLYQAEQFHMLMIDMGAGTTDLALCRYSRKGK